jgi:hypothetical protein
MAGVEVRIRAPTGEDRRALDAVLREVAAAGILVSCHPDVIDRIGTDVIGELLHPYGGLAGEPVPLKDGEHRREPAGFRTRLDAVLVWVNPVTEDTGEDRRALDAVLREVAAAGISTRGPSATRAGNSAASAAWLA